jgi:hypothetical protein
MVSIEFPIFGAQGLTVSQTHHQTTHARNVHSAAVGVLLVQHDLQEFTVNGQSAPALVVHQAELPELTQEMADARPGGAHHLGQVFLINPGKHSIGSTSRAQLRESQENPGQAPLTKIEESIREVFFHSHYACKQVRDQAPRKSRITMDHPNQTGPIDAGDCGKPNCRCGRHPEGSMDQTALSEHIARSQDRGDGMFAVRRCNHEFHVSIQDLEHRIGRVALRIDGLPVHAILSRLLGTDPFEDLLGT